MNPSKLEDAARGVTRTREGKEFAFESPVPGVHIYSNVWPNSMDFMNELLTEEFWDNYPKEGYAKRWVREDFYDKQEFTKENGKQSDTCWVRDQKDANDAFRDVVASYLFHWDLDPRSRESLRISRYSNGEFFGAHADDTYATPRTVSLVYYPNDDYEGGELEFIHFNKIIKPKAGQLFIFPSAYSYEHRIHEIRSGNPRWTIVTFLSFGEMSEIEERHKTIKVFPYRTNMIDLF
jgi:hypothetical protein